jgi:hypothetical protein
MKEEEMGDASSTYGRDETCIQVVSHMQGRGHLEDISIDGKDKNVKLKLSLCFN